LLIEQYTARACSAEGRPKGKVRFTAFVLLPLGRPSKRPPAVWHGSTRRRPVVHKMLDVGTLRTESMTQDFRTVRCPAFSLETLDSRLPPTQQPEP
jgi:hypothetical protein